MRIDNVHHLQTDQDTIVLPKNPGMIYIETHDNEGDIFQAVRQQAHPVVLVLPKQGKAFTQPEHFSTLRHLLSTYGYPPLVHFLIPARRVQETHFAEHYGFSHSSSLEEALQMLAKYYFPQKDTEHPTSHKQEIRFSLQEEEQLLRHTPPTQRLPPRNTPLPQCEPPQNHPVRRRVPLLLLALLVGISIIIFPLLFLPTRPKTGSSTMSAGTLSFASSGQIDPTTATGYNDSVALNVQHISSPRPGMAYYAWLLPDKTNDEAPPLLLGKLPLHAGNATLFYASPQHTNLLATYSGVRVIEASADTTMAATPSQNPSTWQAEGWIPNTPTPGDEKGYSFLSHLRHLLATDPTLKENNMQGGLVTWLTRNTAKVEEWASAAQGQWKASKTTSGDADMIHRHMLRILAYLDGAFYYLRDVPKDSPRLVDPLSGTFGLLNSLQNQNPPGYLAHVDIHLTGLANSLGHTQEQNALAVQIDDVINRMNRDLQQVRKDAIRLVQMDIPQVCQGAALSLLNDMANLTTEVKSGWFDARTGENSGGVLWIESRLQQLATISLTRRN